MYREFYGMKHQPFSRNVPPEDLYESKAMTEKHSDDLHMLQTVSCLQL